MHHNIIQIYSVIENPTTIFLIMEYASGGELYDYIVLKKRLSDFEACKFFHQIINGVEYIHKVGVVHRDLKPENLLLDHKNYVKIVDFGLSNIYKNGLNFMTPCGSPCYAAPEMIQGKIYNGMQVDIWSIGIILYAMLCGFLPFDDPDNDILYKKIIEGKFTMPNFLSDNAKDLLKNILNTDPDKRYTLRQIRSHPWFNRIPVMINEGLLVNVINIPVDENILEKMTLYGYNKDETREYLLNNKHNNATATYYLLMKKNYRNGISSVSDMVSIEFLRHIRNPQNLKFGDSRPNGLVDSNVTYTNILENKSNFNSNICVENEIQITEPEEFREIQIQTNIKKRNESIIYDDLKVSVYENNFFTETNISTLKIPNPSKRTSKISNYQTERRGKNDYRISETYSVRASSVKSPNKNAYRSTSVAHSNQIDVKNMTATTRRPNKINVPNIPTGPKQNIKKKIEEQYEKYAKNPGQDKVRNNFKKGFLNTSAIFEKSSDVRSRTIDKYKSENNKYGSNIVTKTSSVSKKISDSPYRTESIKSPKVHKQKVNLSVKQ
jgi:5'-AMP-activated protein kinase catalytic alpha subunit